MELVTICVIVAIVSILILYDHFTKLIPSRLHAEQAPKSGYGLMPAGIYDAPAANGGVEYGLSPHEW